MEIIHQDGAYPYYQFGQWTPDGKWNFLVSNASFIICRSFIRNFEPQDYKTEPQSVLTNIIVNAVNDDLAQQNWERSADFNSPPTPGAITYHHWKELIVQDGNYSDAAWTEFRSKIKPLIMFYVNANSELWAAYTLQINLSDYNAAVMYVGDDRPQFDNNAPTVITGSLLMSVGDTGIG